MRRACLWQPSGAGEENTSRNTSFCVREECLSSPPDPVVHMESELKSERMCVGWRERERADSKGNRIDVVLHPVLFPVSHSLILSHPSGREMRTEWIRRMS